MSSEPESTPEAEAVPEVTSEPEPEVIPEGEAEPPPSFIFWPSPEKSADDNSQVWPEPEPEWSSAFQEWGAAWPIHVYVFGLCYTFAFIFALICVVSVLKKVKAGKGKLTISLLVMVVLFNISRAISLFTDPYYAFNNIHFMTARIIWSVGMPFLTSSFSLVFLVLLDTTRMDIGPPRFQKISAILTITAIHVVIVITTDFVVFYHAAAKAMLVVCQVLFFIYGLTLAIGYMYVGIKMRQNSAAGSMHDSGSIHRLVCLCFVSSATSIAIVATQIYSAVGVFGVYSSETTVDSWSWWILQTFLRIEELISVGVVLTIASNSEHLREFFSGLCRRRTTKVVEINITQTRISTCNDITRNETGTKTTWSS